MSTVQALLRSSQELPTDSPRRDAEILLGHCLGKPRSWLYAWPEAEVNASQRRQFEQLIARRTRGEPIAYLTGHREFWSLQLTVDEHTLIPRPETETLVDWALALPLPGDARVLDLGTGSGAIALAVASERPRWQVTALDCSDKALRVAAANAAQTGLSRVTFLQSDWFSAVTEQRFDLLLANPPYIDQDDPHLTRGDVRFEPRSALVAQQQGIADLARVTEQAALHMRAGAWLLLEHGYGQGEAVRQLLLAAGLVDVTTRRDLAGHERISGGRLC